MLLVLHSIRAYKNNIAGFGIGVRYSVDQDETPEMAAEFTRAEEIVELLNVEQDTKEVFEDVIEAREIYGISYIEVIRNLAGEVAQIEFVQDIPSMVKTMGKSVFEECTALDSVRIEGFIDEIDTDAFRHCHSLHTITIPVSVKRIGSKAFEGCTSLAGIALPITLQTIGSDAFARCVTLQSVTIPAAVKDIGGGAFRECSALTTVNLSVGLKQMGGSAFAKCVNLREVDVKAPLPPKISKSTFKDVILATCRFYIPRGSRMLYIQDKQWQKITQLVER